MHLTSIPRTWNTKYKLNSLTLSLINSGKTRKGYFGAYVKRAQTLKDFNTEVLNAEIWVSKS